MLSKIKIIRNHDDKGAKNNKDCCRVSPHWRKNTIIQLLGRTGMRLKEEGKERDCLASGNHLFSLEKGDYGKSDARFSPWVEREV